MQKFFILQFTDKTFSFFKKKSCFFELFWKSSQIVLLYSNKGVKGEGYFVLASGYGSA